MTGYAGVYDYDDPNPATSCGEPVAWLRRAPEGDTVAFVSCDDDDDGAFPVYTAQPAASVGVEEIARIINPEAFEKIEYARQSNFGSWVEVWERHIAVATRKANAILSLLTRGPDQGEVVQEETPLRKPSPTQSI